MSVGFSGGKVVDQDERLRKAIRRAGFFALRRLGFLVRKRAQESIEPSAAPSEPGEPPHTRAGSGRHGGRQRSTSGHLPKAILYDTEDNPPAVIIGPSEDLIGKVGRPMEHGGEFRGRTYPRRPFMGPALEEEEGELPGFLASNLDQQTQGL